MQPLPHPHPPLPPSLYPCRRGDAHYVTGCKFAALKENTLSHYFQNYSNQTKHTPQGVFNGGSGFATKGETGEGSDPPHQKTESSLFPSCLTPSFS